VLAELFTGSECPPCVGADLAFDGLVEAVPAKYLAVLVYHLPIPRRGLKVVFFVQDTATRKVLNAVVADVK
jgi:thiol-disulfide isomerase/thioredoxin